MIPDQSGISSGLAQAVSASMFTYRDIDRFWGWVLQFPGCWLWTGRTHYRDGTGKFRYGDQHDPHRRKEIAAHRVAYALKIDPLEEGEKLAKFCTSIFCVNPYHYCRVTEIGYKNSPEWLEFVEERKDMKVGYLGADPKWLRGSR